MFLIACRNSGFFPFHELARQSCVLAKKRLINDAGYFKRGICVGVCKSVIILERHVLSFLLSLYSSPFPWRNKLVDLKHYGATEGRNHPARLGKWQR